MIWTQLGEALQAEREVERQRAPELDDNTPPLLVNEPAQADREIPAPGWRAGRK
jgi:hypothetical protein